MNAKKAKALRRAVGSGSKDRKYYKHQETGQVATAPGGARNTYQHLKREAKGRRLNLDRLDLVKPVTEYEAVELRNE